MANLFTATAKKLVDQINQSDASTTHQIIADALMAAYLKGRKDEVNLKTNGKPPKNPNGGWLPPNERELATFEDAVQAEATRRFGVDEDNDPCVIVYMYDRSRYEHMRLLPVPRDIKENPYHPYGKQRWGGDENHTPEEQETRNRVICDNKVERIRMISGNLQTAMDWWKQLAFSLEYEYKKRAEHPVNEREKRIKSLEHAKKWWADPIASLRQTGYEVDEVNGVYWNPSRGKETPLKDNKSDVRPIPKKPADFDADMAELERLKAFTPAPELEL